MPDPSIRDLLHDPDALRLRLTDLHVDSITCWVPDTIGERTAEQPMHFSFALHANRVTWLSVHGAHSCEVTSAVRGKLVESALAVLRHGDVEPGPDTAIGRDVTTVSLVASLPGLPGDDAWADRAHLRINHYAHGGCSATPWRVLLDNLVSVVVDMADEDRVHADFLRAHFPDTSEKK